MKIASGRVVTEKKSVFQAHTAKVEDKNDVDAIINTLKEKKKISRATHRITAFRIPKNDGTIDEGYKDDGEHGAGRKVLDLLCLMNVINVVVVITRWYGGKHLGEQRFRIICNLAREIVQDHCIPRKPSYHLKIKPPKPSKKTKERKTPVEKQLQNKENPVETEIDERKNLVEQKNDKKEVNLQSTTQTSPTKLKKLDERAKEKRAKANSPKSPGKEKPNQQVNAVKQDRPEKPKTDKEKENEPG